MQIILPDGSVKNVSPPPQDGEDKPIDFLDIEIAFFMLLRSFFPLSVKVGEDADTLTKVGFKPEGGKITMQGLLHLTQSFARNPSELLAVAWAPELDKMGQKTPLSSDDLAALKSRLPDPDEPS